MSRFTGKQYPGALKDLRALKREEAEARQAASRLKTLQGMQQLGEAVKQPGPFQVLVDAFTSIANVFTSSRDTTQNDYALAADASAKGLP